MVSGFLDRVACFALGCVAPESLVFFAFHKRLCARKEHKIIVALMGKVNWSVVHEFHARMGGVAIEVASKGVERDYGCDIGYVHESCILRYFEEGRISMDAWVTEKEILDKGKADSLIKTFTILQLLWLLFQCIARVV
jgi:hypothetical protein